MRDVAPLADRIPPCGNDRPRRDPRPLPRLGRGHRPLPLPGPGGGAPRAHGGEARHPRDAHGLRKVARRPGPPLQGGLRGEGLVLHEPDQGAREREVLLPLRGARARERRDADRRREHQPRGERRLLHGRGPLEHGASPRAGARGALRRDGRVPLLRRQGARRGVAGAAPRPPGDPVPPHVGDARRHARDRRAAAARHGARGRARDVRRAAGAARLRVPRDAAPRDDRGAARREEEPGLRRQLHAEGVRGAGAVADEREDRDPRRAGGDPEGRRRDPAHDPLRQGVPPVPLVRDRRPPRRPPPEVPPPRGAARAEGAPPRHLRDRHAGRRREHPDPDGPLHEAREVRRDEGGAPLRPRVQADRRARGAARVRRRRGASSHRPPSTSSRSGRRKRSPRPRERRPGWSRALRRARSPGRSRRSRS